MSDRLREKIGELEERRTAGRAMGGERRIKRQHGRGKMTCRERVDALVDEGSFLELGILGSEYETPVLAADGVVTGIAKIDGRSVCLAAYDFTVKGGSIGLVGLRKVARLRELALRNRVPMVWLVDSGGARIDPRPENLEKIPLFAASGHMFREQVIMSGVVPQVANPIRYSDAELAYSHAGPTLGQHTDEVLGGLLGMSGEDIAGLRDRGII